MRLGFKIEYSMKVVTYQTLVEEALLLEMHVSIIIELLMLGLLQV